MSAPVRIQRRRTKGWRMPEGAVYVGRGTKWGNPFKVKNVSDPSFLWRRAADVVHVETGGSLGRFERWSPNPGVDARYWAMRGYNLHLQEHPELVAQAAHDLAGRDLMCWCPLDQPCHADVLLELANNPAVTS